MKKIETELQNKIKVVKGTTKNRYILDESLLKLCHFPLVLANKEEERLLKIAKIFIECNGNMLEVQKKLEINYYSIDILLRNMYLSYTLNNKSYKLINEYLEVNQLLNTNKLSERKNQLEKIVKIFQKRNYNIKKTASTLGLTDATVINLLSSQHTKFLLEPNEQVILSAIIENYTVEDNELKNKNILEDGYEAINNRHDKLFLAIMLKYIFNFKKEDLINIYGSSIGSKTGNEMLEDLKLFFNDKEVINEIEKGLIDINPIHEIPDLVLEHSIQYLEQLKNNASLADNNLKNEILSNIEMTKLFISMINRKGSISCIRKVVKLSDKKTFTMNFPNNLRKYMSISVMKDYYSYLKTARNDYKENTYFEFSKLPLIKREKLLANLLCENNFDIPKTAFELHTKSEIVRAYLKKGEIIRTHMGEEVYLKYMESVEKNKINGKINFGLTSPVPVVPVVYKKRRETPKALRNYVK
ncbi:MAG: hypothetical protein PHN42_01005 [Bacilli bacterium]|nr:hypothetical protein [Bacilli bacterium]